MLFIIVLSLRGILNFLNVLNILDRLGFFILVERVANALLVGRHGLGIYLANAGYLVVLLLQIDEPYALSGAAHNSQRADAEPDGDTALVDDDKVVAVVHILDSNKLASLGGNVNSFNTFTATVGHAVVLKGTALAHTQL